MQGPFQILGFVKLYLVFFHETGLGQRNGKLRSSRKMSVTGALRERCQRRALSEEDVLRKMRKTTITVREKCR